MKTQQRLILLALLPLCSLSGCHYLNHNLRTVEEGAFYRSGQMKARALDRWLDRLQIACVINLRGASPEEQWYQEEVALCADRNVAHQDLDWSMNALPAPESLARFVQIIEERQGPILVHCQGGTHRSGIAAAAYVLIQGGSMDSARRELDIFFNNAPIGQLLTLYDNQAPSADFATWVREIYPQRYTKARAELN